MRINELLTEDQALAEGPKFNKFGQAVCNVAGMAAKGLGAVAGGIAGLGAAAKKGFQAGKAQVAAADDGAADAPAAGGDASGAQPAAGAAPAGGDAAAPAAPAGGKKPGFIAGLKAGLAGKKGEPAAEPAAAPAGGAAAPAAAPAAAGGASAEEPAAGGGAPSAADINAQGPKGTAPAKQQTGAAAQALAKTDQATQGANAEKAGQTVYAQVKSQIDKLDKKGKQRILQLLQKSLTQPAPADQKAPAGAAPAAGGAAAPAAQPAAAPAAQPAAAPAAEPAAAPAAEPAAAPAAQPAAAPAAEPAAAKKKRAPKKAAAPSQAEIDADRERLMGPTSDSKINTGNPLAEALAQRVEQHKRKMFETSLRKGEVSIFVK